MAASPTMDDAFRALADPSRRLLLDRARQSVSKHLAVLEEANLVTTVRRGREKLHYLNAAPINEIAERWITRYEQSRVEALADLKRALEDSPMDQPSFVYTTYIRTTPEKLWQALTEPAFTERYWDITFDSDWTTGSPMTWHQRGVAIADGEQVVVEANPYTHLAYTWHSFTAEWAAAFDVAEDRRERLAAERRSKVTFEIEPLDDQQVKLTVVHDDLEPGGLLAGMISGGWPRVLANLKTLLETGEPPL